MLKHTLRVSRFYILPGLYAIKELNITFLCVVTGPGFPRKPGLTLSIKVKTTIILSIYTLSVQVR